MPYNLHMPPEVQTYLRNLPDLSREARVILWASLFDMLRHSGDALRADPSRRLAPDSPNFQCSLVLRDPHSGRLHRVRVVVNDAAAAYGVLVVEYIEHQVGPATNL